MHKNYTSFSDLQDSRLIVCSSVSVLLLLTKTINWNTAEKNKYI